MRFLKYLLTLTLFLSAFAGDCIVFKSKYSDSFVFRAFADSLVHGTIGLLSACLFFTYKLNISAQSSILYIIFCAWMSSAIDVDHVFVAKSLNLKDYTNLKQRGIFHCTTFWILVTTLLLLYSFYTKKFNILVLTFMEVLAVTSHHIRDGNRRGLWMYPFGHTIPINKYIYALLLGLLPNVFALLFVYCKRDFNEIEYIIV